MLEILGQFSRKNTDHRKGKCFYISPVLECHAGGEGHIACLDHKYHNKCPYRKNLDEKIKDEKLFHGMKMFED